MLLVCGESQNTITLGTALGSVGFLTTLIFLIYSAPDVAKTQLLVETLLVIFIAIVLRHLPKSRTVAKASKSRRGFHMAIAGSIGLSMGAFLFFISHHSFDPAISDFYSSISVSGGHGRNIVNVILVDFRAFDTLGEVVVVVIASIAAVAAIGQKHFRPLQEARTSKTNEATKV